MKQSYGIILEGELDTSFANTESILHCFMVYYPFKGRKRHYRCEHKQNALFATGNIYTPLTIGDHKAQWSIHT